MPDEKEYFDSNSPAQSNKHWIPWVQRQLILKKILAQAVEMPEPYKPNYKKWCEVFEQFKLDQNTTLIGHSCGGGFLVRWLSENKNKKVGKVILVAPWIDPDRTMKSSFFNFNIDPALIKRTKGVTVFISNDKYKDVLETVGILKTAISGIKVIELKNKGHFTMSGMKTEKFPELLKAL